MCSPNYDDVDFQAVDTTYLTYDSSLDCSGAPSTEESVTFPADQCAYCTGFGPNPTCNLYWCYGAELFEQTVPAQYCALNGSWIAPIVDLSACSSDGSTSRVYEDCTCCVWRPLARPLASLFSFCKRCNGALIPVLPIGCCPLPCHSNVLGGGGGGCRQTCWRTARTRRTRSRRR